MRHNQRPTSFGTGTPCFRTSFSVQSELNRISFAHEGGQPRVYREGVGAPLRPRNTVDVGMSEQMRPSLEGEERPSERGSFSNLKSTLSQLERKINKARKQLNSYKNIISEDEEEEELVAGGWEEKPALHYEHTTVGSSMNKLLLGEGQSGQRCRHYYLSQLVGALQGSNPRALEHLVVSHKILKNHHKL